MLKKIRSAFLRNNSKLGFKRRHYRFLAAFILLVLAAVPAKADDILQISVFSDFKSLGYNIFATYQVDADTVSMVPGSMKYVQNYGLVSGLLLPVGPFTFAGGTGIDNISFFDVENDHLQLIGTAFGNAFGSEAPEPGIYTTANYISDIIRQEPWIGPGSTSLVVADANVVTVSTVPCPEPSTISMLLLPVIPLLRKYRVCHRP